MSEYILPLVTFFPLLAMLILLLMPASAKGLLRWTALLLGLVEFGLSIPLWTAFSVADAGHMQFVIQAEWLPVLHAQFHMGLDGISLMLVLLTTLLLPVVIVGTWREERHLKAYLAMFFLLTVGMVGVFVALDLILFYVFWELVLIPMYFLIGIWGGQRRIYAAVKFFLYTMAGSVLMLIAILFLYWNTHLPAGGHSFNLLEIYRYNVLAPGLQRWLLAAFVLAFAIKVPMFPFHTWLPDAHVEAPTGGSVILAGVLLKMGTYGLLRFAMPLFPDALHAALPLLVALSVIGILYGAWVSIVQQDMKKLVAYSSVSHMGFVTLGLFALNSQGASGAVLQMVNHGITTGALFLAVGVIYERRHTRMIAEFGGLARSMPGYAFVLVFLALASIGLPGLNGFVGEFLTLLGAFQSHPMAASLAATGVIFAAVYLLWMVQRVLFGPLDNPKNSALGDLNLREWLVFVPLMLLMLVLGVWPDPLLERIEPAVSATLQMLQ